MQFSKIINLGSQSKELSAITKVQTMNFITLFTVLLSALYSAFYYFYLNEPKVAAINLIFTIAYACGFIIMAVDAPTKAKHWFFIVLMLHLWVCTNVYVTKDSGFHLFYFLVPTGAFLLFELHQFKQKLVLSILATILLFYCQNTVNPTPLIELNTELNNVLYQSVIFCIMVEVLIVLNLFGRQLERTEKELKQLASIDLLTRTNSRDYFFTASDQHFRTCKKSNRPFSLLLINIDNFRRVNELYGHKVGDCYLQSITEKIKNVCSDSDVFGRLGGEEFIIAMPERTILEAKRLARKINTLFNSTAVTESSEMRCTASIGAITNSANIAEFSELIAYSDQALHKAKAKGTGRIEEYLASA